MWATVKWIDERGIGRLIGIVHINGASQGQAFLAQMNGSAGAIRYFFGPFYQRKVNAVKAVKRFSDTCELYGHDRFVRNGYASYDVHEVL